MGKYINIFETEQEFLEFKNSDSFSNYSISYVSEDQSVWYGSIKRTPAEVETLANNFINNIINTSV